MSTRDHDAVPRAIEALPSGSYVMTSAYEGERAGVLVSWVTRVADEPALVCVAVRKGHAIEPLIRDSRAFALCRVDAEDKLVRRTFSDTRPPDERGDLFDSIAVRTLATGAPVLSRSTLALDCEVVRHFDLEADHELYVGQVVGALAP